jgi:hypothetical protein
MAYKYFLEADSLSCIYGDPAVGKSFIGIEAAAAIATGANFYGLPVKNPGPVIYLCGEGQAGINRRRFWEIKNSLETNGLVIIQDILASLSVRNNSISDVSDGNDENTLKSNAGNGSPLPAVTENKPALAPGSEPAELELFEIPSEGGGLHEPEIW